MSTVEEEEEEGVAAVYSEQPPPLAEAEAQRIAQEPPLRQYLVDKLQRVRCWVCRDHRPATSPADLAGDQAQLGRLLLPQHHKLLQGSALAGPRVPHAAAAAD